MHVHLLEDAVEFAGAVEDFLARERFTANVIAVQVDGIVRLGRPQAPGSVWAVVEEDGAVIGVAMQTPPFALFLPRLENAVIESIAEAFASANILLPGVSGEVSSVECFAVAWQRLTGKSSVRRTAMRLYALDDLGPTAEVSGTVRQAAEGDLGLVESWLSAFHDEAQPTAPRIDLNRLAQRRIAHGDLWLWQHDGEAVSLAGVSAPAVGVSRVGPVYTPPLHRRNGYGAAVTAVASQVAIDLGATDVVLYTDLANPTSNSIYQAIGYVPNHDAEERDFTA